MKTNEINFVGLLLLTVIISLSFVASSKEKPLDEMTMEELMNVQVVTASNRLQTLAEVPVTIYVITGEDIKQSDSTLNDTLKKGIKSIADMNLEELANVQVSPFNVSTRLDSGYRASNSVSGSGFDAPIRELPFAIQAFTVTFIKDQKPVNIFDVARYSPGVTYRSNDFNEGNSNLAIRGFAVGSVAGGNIHILRDGFHGPSVFDFTNISRVEVVKGPASFLYGQVAPGGIVNIITKSPQLNFSANANARYGSYNQYRFDADVTGPLTKTLFYRLSASYDMDMHYWKPYNAYSRNISPSLLWKPNKFVKISLKYENFYKNEEPQLMQKPGYNIQAGIIPTESDPNLSGVDVPGLPDNWNSMSFSDYRYSTTNALNAWIDFKVNQRWNLRAGYSHVDYKTDALFSGNLGMANNVTRLQGRRVRRQVYNNNDNCYETQALGQYKLGFMSLRMFLGVQYINRSFDSWAGQAPNDPVLGSNPTASPLPLWNLSDPTTWNRNFTFPLTLLTEGANDQTIEYNDKSAYCGTTFGFFNDRLLVLAGWRQTSTKSILINNIDSHTQASSVSMITPQYGILFKLTNNLSAFASYAKSFVPGTNQIKNLDGTIRATDPTKGRGYDIGLKTEVLDDRISSTLTYFDISNENIVNDLAYTDSLGIVTIYNVQSGEQRSKGIEFDATINATNNWQLYVSYSYMDAHITQFSGTDEAILAQNLNTLDEAEQTNYKNVKRFHNAPLQMSAPHLTNLWMRYNFTLSKLKGIYIAGGYNYIFDQTLLPDSPISSHQTYILVNATLGYSWGWHNMHFGADIMGKNLANVHYRPSQSTRGRPREFLVTLSANF